jgi:SPX domain protein involved in polyphosphate accumulation
MVYFIHSTLTDMFRSVIRPSARLCTDYKNKIVVNCVTIRPLHHTDNTLPIFWIKTRHIPALVIAPQTLNTLNSHIFNNYPFILYIYIT